MACLFDFPVAVDPSTSAPMRARVKERSADTKRDVDVVDPCCVEEFGDSTTDVFGKITSVEICARNQKPIPTPRAYFRCMGAFPGRNSGPINFYQS